MATKAAILHTFNQIITNKLTGYRGIYECECPKLHRNLPFRAEFEQRLLAHITQLKPDPAKPLVYTSLGSGGLFFDFVVLNKLIEQGYSDITAIFIEELYQDNLAIIQACLDLKAWFIDLKKAHRNKPTVTPHFFVSTQEYAAACAQSPHIKCDAICVVDPDDTMSMPRFDSKKIRKKTIELFKQTLHNNGSYSALFADSKVRHMIQGTIHQTEHCLFFYDHTYDFLSDTATVQRRVFLNQQEVLPFEPLDYGVQIGTKQKVSPELHAYFSYPLATSK